ncbi:DUF4873 domain-containing protein [Actinocrispum sp. NPDC049592]|uniref:DUF4873 domain-containing protein n=1 Tax=Actinocrispum sp. NPDC049592 TaxID=3154835 RepID=UPI00342BEA07
MNHDVVIVGAGLSGLCMAIGLKRTGVQDFVVLEKAGRAGGTWRDNTYPGAGCDIMALLYSFSFAPSRMWTRTYAGQREILDYIDRVIADFELAPYIRLNTEAVRYTFDQATDRWRIDTADGYVLTARIVVTAQGPLHHPHIPDLSGLSTFAGPVFHTARWDHSVDLTGKRVAVIGTGASSVQLVPQIAKIAAHVSVFQRTPHWIIPKHDRPISANQRTLLRLLPFLQRARRYALYWFYESTIPGFVNPKYQKSLQALASGHLARKVRDPELRRKLTPSYVVGCKRILVSNDYYPTLECLDVDLVTDPIQEVAPDAVVTGDGARHKVDVIILATGFKIYESTMDVTGRATLAEAWKDGAEAYLGMMVAGFPNFFWLLGPNSGGGNQSLIFTIEAQVRYILGCLKLMGRTDSRAIEVRPHIQARFNKWAQQRLRRSVWNTGCHSWYLDANGVNRALWPGSSLLYWRRTRRPKVDDFILTPFEGDLDETHRSAAVVTANGAEIPVEVHLTGHLQPIDGSYQWYGRIQRNPEITALHESGLREVTVRLPGGKASNARLTEIDPWGNVRVTGTGRPPFPTH